MNSHMVLFVTPLFALDRRIPVSMSRVLIQRKLRVKAATSTVQRDLGILRTLGLIELRGRARGAYWIRKGGR